MPKCYQFFLANDLRKRKQELNQINFFSPLSRLSSPELLTDSTSSTHWGVLLRGGSTERRTEKSEVIKFESFRRAFVGYRSQLSTAGRRSGFLRVQVGEVDYEFVERTGGFNMIDRLIIYLWLFLSIVLIIAAAEKMSCLNL